MGIAWKLLQPGNRLHMRDNASILLHKLALEFFSYRNWSKYIHTTIFAQILQPVHFDLSITGGIINRSSHIFAYRTYLHVLV